MKRGLKLYVWEDVLSDYTSGIMFALATSPDEAREIIIKKSKNSLTVIEDLNNSEPDVYTDPVGFYVWGGG